MGMFDDLAPASEPATGGMFDDLQPDQPEPKTGVAGLLARIDAEQASVSEGSAAPPALPGVSVGGTAEGTDIPVMDLLTKPEMAASFQGLGEQEIADLIGEHQQAGAVTEGGFKDIKFKADTLRFKKDFPELNKQIESMGGLESFLVGSGEGFNNLISAIGLTDKPDSREMAALDELRRRSFGAQAGRFTGEVAPFLPLGGAAANIPRVGARIPAQAAVTGLEGGLVARGRGGSTEEQILGAGLGAVLGGSLEALSPFIRRAGQRALGRLRGDQVTPDLARVIDDQGNLTPEFQQYIQREGIDFDSLVQAERSQPVAAQFAEEATSPAVERTIDAQRLAPTAPTPRAAETSLESIARTVDPSPERLAAAEALGLQDVPPGVLSRSQPVQEVSGMLAAVPGTVASEQLDIFASRLGVKADEIIQELGGSLDKVQASGNLVERMGQRREALFAAESEAYDAVRKAIDPKTIVNSKPLISQIQKEAVDVGGVRNLNAPTRRVLNALRGKPTYGLIDRERKLIGEAIGKRLGPYKDASSAELDRLYGQLTQMQEGVANTFGAKELWRAAKNQTVERKGLEESITGLFGRDLSTPLIPKVESALKGITGRQYGSFVKLANSLPVEERGEIVATALNGIFTSGRGQDQQFTASQFNKWFKNLKRSPAATRALRDSLPEGGLERLNSLAQIAEGMTGVTKNRVRTGIVKAALDDFDKANGLAAKMYGLADKIDAVPGSSLSMLPQGTRLASSVVAAATRNKTPAVEAIDNLITSPAFKRFVVQAANDQAGTATKNMQSAIVKTDAYKNFIKRLPPSDAAQIASAGLIGFLFGGQEEGATAREDLRS